MFCFDFNYKRTTHHVSVGVASGVAVFILLHDSSTEALPQNSPVNFRFWSNLFGGEVTLMKMDQYRQNMGYRGFNRGRFSPFYAPCNAGFRAPPVFVIHVPAPVQQVHTGCCSHKMNNYARSYKTSNSVQKKAKRASKHLRDRLRREKFLEQKVISVAFPFSELTDEEMTDALPCQDMTRLSELVSAATLHGNGVIASA